MGVKKREWEQRKGRDQRGRATGVEGGRVEVLEVWVDGER